MALLIGSFEDLLVEAGVVCRRGCACSVIVALLVALGADAEAYRTAGDLSDFADTERVRWDGPIPYERASWLPDGMSQEAFDDALAAAVATWSDLDCAAATFVDEGTTSGVASPLDGRVTIQWISQDWTTLGFDADAAAATDVVYERIGDAAWHISDADVFLNAEGHAWTTDGVDASTRDVQAVLTHELGHALGLLHPCEHDGADGAPSCGPAFDGVAMHPDYSLGQRMLSEDDEAGACFLYESAPCEAEACSDGFTCTSNGCAAICDDTICAIGERCGPFGCTLEPCAPGSCERGCDDTCEAPGGALGDPCLEDVECYSGVCATPGFCTVPCADDSTCPTGSICDQSTAPAECLPSSGVLGEDCSSGDDCLSGECLLEEDVANVCTRVCGAGARDCPGGYTCQSVDGLDVCVPPGSTGCAVAVGPAGRSRPTPGAVLFGGLLVAMWSRRRRT